MSREPVDDPEDLPAEDGAPASPAPAATPPAPARPPPEVPDMVILVTSPARRLGSALHWTPLVI
ncbi:hypothetical protein [Sorangium sp. So ce131]|uniref:hypothetical protein n=1 Tax=Sorangium sp. So ce131 TaxID=3133282 RepID=UPI003F5E5A43